MWSHVNNSAWWDRHNKNSLAFRILFPPSFHTDFHNAHAVRCHTHNNKRLICDIVCIYSTIKIPAVLCADQLIIGHLIIICKVRVYVDRIMYN